jgi:Mg-chelatase subunit ChlD
MIQKTLISLFFFFSIVVAYAQVQLSKTDLQLGEIERLNEDILDINISNLTTDKVFLLRIDAPKHLSIRYTSKQITPHSAQLLRIKLNPRKKGKLKEKIWLHFSNSSSPIPLTVTADIKEIPKDNRTACPDFNKDPQTYTSSAQFHQQTAGSKHFFYVELYDTANETVLASAKVEEEEEKEVEELEAPRERRASREKRPRKSPEERRNSPSVLDLLFGDDAVEVSDTTEVEQEELIVEENDTVAIAEETDEKLLDEQYRANNVIFLIDASTSMNEEEKMDLLKQAMIQLLSPLRQIDYLSIVTYSGDAHVLLPPTSGIEKEAIQQQIEAIEAEGSTQAVKGIKKALQLGRSNFIEGGNNQIILATDGAFDIGERNQSLRQKISKAAKDGLSISVLGIKNARWTNKSLKEITDLGKGHLIKINGSKDAGKVLEEIKRQSKI